MEAEKIKITRDPRMEEKFSSYPPYVKSKLENLRSLILSVASENSRIHDIEETLKWGEPSYIVKKGSTIRIDWKTKYPDQYAMYFKCTSKLVPTFKKLYGDTFSYENNRAIVFSMDEDINTDALRQCINLALNYHVLKSGEPFV